VTVKDRRARLLRRDKDSARERWMKPGLAVQHRHGRAGRAQLFSPEPGGVEAADRLPRAVAEALDEIEHESLGAARV
jgi:hypothetical protein